MSLYLLELAPGSAGPLKNGVNAMIVSAADQAQAEKAAAAKFAGFVSTLAWDGANGTVLADVAANADDALLGWRFSIVVSGGAAQTVDPLVIEFTGTAAADTIDTIADELVILLNASDDIANAAYVSATQVLTISSIADGIGDANVTVEVYPPAELNVYGEQLNEDIHQPGFVTATTDGGIAGAALDVTFAADTLVVPRVLATLRS